MDMAHGHFEAQALQLCSPRILRVVYCTTFCTIDLPPCLRGQPLGQAIVLPKSGSAGDRLSVVRSAAAARVLRDGGLTDVVAYLRMLCARQPSANEIVGRDEGGQVQLGRWL